MPNSDWYPRIKVAVGRFDYDQRGILDAGHVRFFTRGDFERLAAVGFRCGGSVPWAYRSRSRHAAGAARLILAGSPIGSRTSP